MANPPEKIPPTVQKFVDQLGTVADFVQIVSRLELEYDRRETIRRLSNFSNTPSGKRYLLVKGDSVGVVDMRHFFAALGETYMGAISGFGAGTAGSTLVLGAFNELRQCVEEGLARKMNSCFSPEDLGSNRLGARFAQSIWVNEASVDPRSLSKMLEDYLLTLKPATPQEINQLKLPGKWETAKEFLGAIFAGIGDSMIGNAY